MNKLKWLIGVLSILVCQEVAKADTASEGARAGIQAGYGLIDAKVKFARVFSPGATDNSDISGRGAVGGFSFDWVGLVGNSDVWMGGEASLNWSTVKGRKSTVGTFVLSPATADLTTTVFFKRALDITFKLGYMARGAAVAYVKAGPSLGHWKASSVSRSTRSSGASASTILGFIFGVGAEFPATERLSWGVEYDYRGYKDFTHSLASCNGIPLRTIAVKPSAHAIMLRLNYKLSATDFSTSPPPKERKRKRYKKPKPTEE